jgi:mono/diheme cytochrome c family protein
MRVLVLIVVALVAASAFATSADDHKSALLADERAAYDKAKPVFDKYCATCHTKTGKQANPKKLDHFEMSSYPFGGHHAATLGPTIRKVLAIDGGKATMPNGKAGTVTGDDLAAIAVWAKAWDEAQAAGAHPSAPPHHDHHHDHHGD